MKRLLVIFIFLSGLQQAAAQDFEPADTATGMVQNAIKNAINEKGIEGKLKININGYERGFNLRDELNSYQFSADDLVLNDKNRNFKTNVAVVSKDNKIKRYNVTGTYEQFIQIPVLAQKTAKNTALKDSDIIWIEVPQDQVKFDTITDKQKLIGQALRRDIAENIQIKERDLQKAQLIARNSTVNIQYSTATISLQTLGVALDNGGQGDVIRVRNSNSNKIIQAMVQDDQNVAAMSETNNLISKNNLPGKTAQIEDDKYVR